LIVQYFDDIGIPLQYWVCLDYYFNHTGLYSQFVTVYIILTVCMSFNLISRAKKGYNTSGLVRYIPKLYNPIKNPQKTPALKSCEKKERILFKNIALESKQGAPKLPKFEDKETQNSLFHAKNCKFLEPKSSP